MFGFAETSEAELFVGRLFRRKFGDPPPTGGRHFVAFVEADNGALAALSYAHFTPWHGAMLGGGAITDERLLRRLPRATRAAISAGGGPYYQLLKYAQRVLSPQCDAIFGYCGDANAEAIDLRAGFGKTAHKHLLVYFPRPLPDERASLIDDVAALGPF